MAEGKTFHLEIVTPDKQFFIGEADSLILPALDGSMGVEAGHEPVATAVVPGDLRFRSGGVWTAAVVGQGGDYLSSHFVCEGGDEVLRAPMPNGNSPFTQRQVSWSGLYMNGPEVYKFAVAGSIRDIRTVVEQAGITMDEVGHFVLHQANLRIIEAVRTRLKQPKEKFPHNIEHYGNTSSASVPILLDELNRAGALQKGEIVVLSAFGAGLCTGACAIRWSK